ncbi:MAG: pseudouridine synthase [Nitrospirales bacterium]|nr:pseudouridine synthase [Nitrospirales bacterium]
MNDGYTKTRKFFQPNTLWSPKFIIFHKPKGLVVTRKDEKQRATVYEALPPFFLTDGWVPIGRLDKLSKGLLLFTQHGNLVDLFTQPGTCEKCYDIVVRGRITEEHLFSAQTGVPSPFGLLKVHKAKKIREIGPKTYLQVILKEGKNRHLRRLFHSFKDPQFHTPLKVLELKRIRIGTLTLDIPSGEWRYITRSEEKRLLQSAKTPKISIDEDV